MPPVKKPLPKAKKGCKTCPNCQFNECYILAVLCEKCSYNFDTKKKPPKKKEVEVDEDEELDLDPDMSGAAEEPPKDPNIYCPSCGAKNFYTALFCTGCHNYDFITQKEIKRVKQKKDEDETPSPDAFHMFRVSQAEEERRRNEEIRRQQESDFLKTREGQVYQARWWLLLHFKGIENELTEIQQRREECKGGKTVLDIVCAAYKAEQTAKRCYLDAGRGLWWLETFVHATKIYELPVEPTAKEAKEWERRAEKPHTIPPEETQKKIGKMLALVVKGAVETRKLANAALKKATAEQKQEIATLFSAYKTSKEVKFIWGEDFLATDKTPEHLLQMAG